MIKKKNFLYRHWQANTYELESAAEIYDSLKVFKDFCVKNNIDFYLVIVPDKEIIYPPNAVLDTQAKNVSNYIKKVSHNGEINIIYPYERFIYNSQGEYLLFYKTDHHATDDGSYILYRSIIEELQKKYKNIKLLLPQDFEYFENNYARTGGTRSFHLGQTCNLMGISPLECKKMHDINYRYYKHKDENNLKITEIKENTLLATKFEYDKGADLRVVLVGDSFIENLSGIFPYSFRNVLKIRLNGPKGVTSNNQFKIMQYNLDDILNYKPNIVIMCVGYSAIQRLKRVSRY